MKPPVAKKVAHTYKIHNQELVDNYHWLRDKNWPEVDQQAIIDYLDKENTYYQWVMESDISENIYNELKSRIKLADVSVPIKRDNYFYYSKTLENSNYPIFCRKQGTLDSEEEIILDANELAKGKSFFALSDISISINHELLAYSIDLSGTERYTIYIKDLNQGVILPDKIEDTIDNIVWDNNGFFYTKLNENWRTDQVFYHKLGTVTAADKLIYREQDIQFRVSISKSTSREYMIINSEAKDSNECLFLKLNADDLTPKLIEKRKVGHLYYPQHRSEYFYIRTNYYGKNFQLIKVAIANPTNQYWQKLIEHDDQKYLTDFYTFANNIVLIFKQQGLIKLEINDYNFVNFDNVDFPDPSYHISVHFTTFEAQAVRFSYSSLNNPEMIIERNFLTKGSTTLKEKEVLGNFDRNSYSSERIYATSSDGKKIPISIVYKKNSHNKKLYLYGYGAYGISVEAYFRSNIISLLDRDFIFAIAHIRGGDDGGYMWYEQGKLLNKKNTFNDFITCAEHLINSGYAQDIVISGGSAGGMLVGCCVNMYPQLFKAAIMHVPFVDVLNTMLDESLPLTPGEFTEWGNPKDKQYFEYISTYSPYENIKAQAYPAMLVTAGISDPRVTYWEPAKWVAKLREYKTNNNLLLLDINMEAGHAGNSGRFGYLKDIAKEYNFIFKVFDVN